MENFTQNQGNNESLTRGMFTNSDNTFLAITFTESKTFKTAKGATKWLAKRGYDTKGNDIDE